MVDSENCFDEPGVATKASRDDALQLIEHASAVYVAANLHATGSSSARLFRVTSEEATRVVRKLGARTVIHCMYNRSGELYLGRLRSK
jgi:hypothetical protein